MIKGMRIDTSKLFQAIVIGFILIQGLSWILSSVSPEIPLLRGGWFLFLMLIAIVVVTSFIVGKNIWQLDFKKDGIFIFLVFIAVTLLFLILPEVVPKIFSAGGMEFREYLIKSFGNIAGFGGTGVV